MAFDAKKELKKIRIPASNSSKAKDAFRERAIFSQFAYSDTASSLDPAAILPIRNFQKYENYMYGRIDTEFLAVVPKKNLLIPFSDGQNSSFRFVHFAFMKMIDEVKRDVVSGKIPTGIPFISDMKAYKSYEDVNSKYNSWVKEDIKGSFAGYVRQFKKKEKIINFETFMGVFREHLMMIADQAGPINFSSFCLTTESNIRASGLCIEVADLDFSKDEDKIEFSKNPYFSYYVNMAQKHGFFVDYNAPWRLIFNLASHENTSKQSWTGLYPFFSDTYEKAHNVDLEILKNLAFTTYRDFYNRFPSFSEIKVEPNGCVRSHRKNRQKYTNQQLKQDYPDSYWLKLYIDLKNIEKNLNFDKTQLDAIKKKSLDYEKYVDIGKAMSYINRVFQDIPSIEGSYYHRLSKMEYKNQNTLPFENFDRYIQTVVKSYKTG